MTKPPKTASFSSTDSSLYTTRVAPSTDKPANSTTNYPFVTTLWSKGTSATPEVGSSTSSFMTSVIYANNETSSPIDVTTSASHQTGTSASRRKTVITTIAPRVSGKTPKQTVKCMEPLPITGGKIVSTGPYLAGVSSAVYSCVNGYVLAGQAKVGCNGTGFWDAPLPNCVLVDNRPDVHNHISLDDSGKVPVWLMVILCVAFGLLCLLLLACLLLYCLKIFGCVKGSAVGTKLVVREGETGSRERGGTGMVIVDNFGSRDNRYTSKLVSYEETDEGFRPARNVRENGRPAGNVRDSIRPVGNHHNYTSERIPDASTERTYLREAKMPANKTWMPHSRNKRSINTSTK